MNATLTPTQILTARRALAIQLEFKQHNRKMAAEFNRAEMDALHAKHEQQYTCMEQEISELEDAYNAISTLPITVAE